MDWTDPRLGLPEQGPTVGVATAPVMPPRIEAWPEAEWLRPWMDEGGRVLRPVYLYDGLNCRRQETAPPLPGGYRAASCEWAVRNFTLGPARPGLATRLLGMGDDIFPVSESAPVVGFYPVLGFSEEVQMLIRAAKARYHVTIPLADGGRMTLRMPHPPL